MCRLIADLLQNPPYYGVLNPPKPSQPYMCQLSYVNAMTMCKNVGASCVQMARWNLISW